MQQKQRYLSRRAVLKGGASVAALGALSGCGAAKLLPDPVATATPTPTASATPEASGTEGVATAVRACRAMWISYLEWQALECPSANAFSTAIATMFDNCVQLGLNTVIVQVRPFGDAMYRSALFPWCHFLTGTQGQDPGYDPLAIMVAEAHARALEIEAWINPYRLRLNTAMPDNLAADNLYYTQPDWVVQVGDGLYLNPALPEAADYVCAGVQEILENYDVDGIHFDDYFYPTTDTYIDETEFAASGASELAAWRRENVSALVKQVYDAVKAHDATLRFGISPQGNPDNNESQQFSDVSAWMNPSEGAECLDYVCPQVYWGYGYTLSAGSTRFAYENIVPEWLAMPRADSVALYLGLGAWRIGDGDGSANEDTFAFWNTGNALATMIADENAQCTDGYFLYRYNSLYASAHEALANSELAALEALAAQSEA